MPLPIIRLVTTSANNANLTDDPLVATATLYSFLRSVPSRAEEEMAMRDFTHALSSSEQRVLEHKGNARVVDALENAIVHGLLRQAPHVSPVWAARNSLWKELLHPNENKTTKETQAALHSGEPPFGTEEYNSEENHLYVKQGALHSHKDPYEDYVDQFNVPIQNVRADLHSAHSSDDQDVIDNNEEAQSQVSSSAVSVSADEPDYDDDMQHSGSTQPPEGDRGDGSSAMSMPPLTPSDPNATCHPLLSLIVSQARNTIPGRESHPQPCEITQKLERVREKLANAKRVVGEEMDAHAATASMWDPSHVYYKNSVSFVEDLEERANVAGNLFRVEKNEQETIRTAHIALLAEVTAMRLLLRDVSRVVDDYAGELQESAAEKHAEDAIDIQEADAQLITEIQAALLA